MNLFVKSEKSRVSDLTDLLERSKIIEDGYIVKEEIEQIKLEKYSGKDIEITDSFYSLIVFDEKTEIKITRDGTDLYFRQMSEEGFDGGKKVDGISYSHKKTYYLKGKYDKEAKIWWESQFSPEFKYPNENNQSIPNESRAGLKVKIYQDEEGEVRYFRFYGYEAVTVEKKEGSDVLEH
ncbi:hypothetical protein KJ693_03145 [bacterium]|nr:hypothetical protein [bacterium]MBU1614287.1 hypothetical protein [bacterium]